MLKIECSNVQQHLYVTVTSYHWPCEGWPGWIIQLHDTCFTVCILLPLAQVQRWFKQLEAVLHAQPLPIQRLSESLLLAFYLWSHTDWGINQQVNAGPGGATWKKVKSTHSNLNSTFHNAVKMWLCKTPTVHMHIVFVWQTTLFSNVSTVQFKH